MRRSHQYPEPQKQSFDQGIQKSAVIGPGTPMQQHPAKVNAQHFFHSQRQVTPTSNEGFRMQHQGKEQPNPANNIVVPSEPPMMQRQVPQGQQFFHNVPQTARNQPGQIKIMQQQSLPGNFQVVQAPKIDRIVEGTENVSRGMLVEPMLTENRHSMQELSPDRRVKVIINSPPLI